MKYIFFFLLIISCACCRSGPEEMGQTSVPRYIYQDTVQVHPLDSIAISYGTFSGMSDGYAESDFHFHSWGIEKINPASYVDSLNYPSQYLVFPIQKPEYDSLISAIDLVALQQLPETIGCPDCNDGGAEWIEIEVGFFHKQINFPCGYDVPGINNLLRQLRKFRKL